MATLAFVFSASAPLCASAAFEIINDSAPAKVEKPKQEVKMVENKSVTNGQLLMIPKTQTLFNKDEIESKYTRLAFEGSSPKFLDKGFSSAKGMKLSDASMLFMKPDWKFVKNTLENPVVSWGKNDYWLGTLNDIAQSANLYFLINWDAKTITASKYPTRTTYTLREGKMLSDELIRWAEKSNWTFLWLLDYDFEIVSNTSYKGSFEEVLLKVVKDYQANGVMLDVVPRTSRQNNTAKLEIFKEHK